jgi:sterol desaturase/sphingolipid hydroxylase (fatty acid hydroxylase superfamily)
VGERRALALVPPLSPHSEERAHGMSNFSSSSLIWDHIFGTYTNPVRVRVERVGIAHDRTSPKLGTQLLAPFQNLSLALSRKLLN